MFVTELSYQKSQGMTTTTLIFRYFNPLFSWSCWVRGVLMVSALVSGSSVFGSWPGTLCCGIGLDTLLLQCLSPARSDTSTVVLICVARRWAGVKRWEIAKRQLRTNLMLAITLRWTSIRPTKGEVDTAISKKVAPVIHDAWCMVHVSYHAAH